MPARSGYIYIYIYYYVHHVASRTPSQQSTSSAAVADLFGTARRCAKRLIGKMAISRSAGR